VFCTATSTPLSSGTQLVETGGQADATARSGGFEDVLSGGTGEWRKVVGGDCISPTLGDANSPGVTAVTHGAKATI